MNLSRVIALACVGGLVAAAACKKQEDTGRTPSGSASTTSAGSASTNSVQQDAHADHITVLAHHKNPKPTDPVRINFERFKVVSANFDPQKVEGGKATIEIDLSSFHTDSDERDEHLKSPAYLDVGKLATATITIDNVKQKAGETYSADATVAAHGMTKSYPITFDVLERKSDSITIKGQHTFARLDFGIGTDPSQNDDEQVGTDVTIEMQLTVTKM